MRAQSVKFSEFEQNGVSFKDMNLVYSANSYRLYTYDLDGALCGTLLSAIGLTDDNWNDEDLYVDVVYTAECDCSSIKNLWIGDEDGNLYYPDIDDIFESLKVLRDLVEG